MPINGQTFCSIAKISFNFVTCSFTSGETATEKVLFVTKEKNRYIKLTDQIYLMKMMIRNIVRKCVYIKNYTILNIKHKTIDLNIAF